MSNGVDPAAMRQAIRDVTKDLLRKPKPNRQQRRAAARRKQHATDRSRAEIVKAMQAKQQENK